MTRRFRVVLLGLPLVAAFGTVLALVNSDAVPYACVASDFGFQRPIYSTCLPTLFPLMTGPDPTAVRLSWIGVGALVYLGLLGWVVFAWRRPVARDRGGGLGLSLLAFAAPLVPSVGAIAYLIGGDGVWHFCPTYREPGFPANACFPSLFHWLTGSDLLVISVSWIMAAALVYTGLLGWALALRHAAHRQRPI